MASGMSSLSKRLKQLGPQSENSFSMYKVPKQLADVNNKAYEPEIVSIGPYHHGQPKFKTTEELKLRYFNSLLQRKPEIQAEEYISAIKTISKEARDCYAEVTMNLDEFTDMLVLDGCFIIEVIQNPKPYRRAFPARSSHGILLRDLILLENQIPWFVLCQLFDLIEGVGHTVLMKGVLEFCEDLFPGKRLYDTTRKPEDVKHILDLVHSNWCPPPPPHAHTYTCPTATTIPLVIPSASELYDANVKFLHNKDYESLFDVEFKSCGKMVMPTLVIDDDTESLLRNLIAYEQLFSEDKLTPVADYATLLDCLINTPKDVHILCRKKIIENMLGSENAVVEFVNRLTDGIVIYDESFMYAGTFDRINRHYQKPWNRALASFHRDYFPTPWACFAFLGAFLLLLLSLAQTIFSGLQLYKSL